MQTLKKKVLIDSGYGTESSVAILMALASPEIDVVGITGYEQKSVDSLQKLCALAQKKAIPVYGTDEAPAFIKAAAEEFGNSLYVASLGSFKNIFNVLQENPTLLSSLKQLIVAEKYLNSAIKELIFTCKERLTLISSHLDGEVKVALPDLVIMEALKTKSATYLAGQIKEKLEESSENYFILYNPIVIACILRPALFGGVFGEEKNILSINEVNIDAFFALLNERLAMLS